MFIEIFNAKLKIRAVYNVDHIVSFCDGALNTELEFCANMNLSNGEHELLPCTSREEANAVYAALQRAVFLGENTEMLSEGFDYVIGVYGVPKSCC